MTVRDAELVAPAGAPRTPAGPDAGLRALDRWITVGAVVAFTLLALPVVLRGAPLADDYNNCLAPVQQGLGGFFASSFDRLGVIRLARFLEIGLTTGVCQHLPFGVAIAVPVGLTLTVAVLVRGLLRDLATPAPWPGIAAAAWLLQPLGTEAALWPAALHVPLGLALALAALRLHRRGHHWGAAAATVGAILSVEQLLLALPVAAWIVAGPERRRRAAAVTGVLVVAAVVLFALIPGSDPRLDASPMARLSGLLEDPLFYVQFPAVGLGLHSIPLAVRWALPASVVVLAAGAAAGWWLWTRVLVARAARTLTRAEVVRAVGGIAVLAVLLNLPVILNVPRQGSPRIFAPTWLLLAAAVCWLGPRVALPRTRLAGAAAGLFAAGAVLSLALSVSVRLDTADFTDAAADHLAASSTDGDVIAVCGVPRTVVEPAPRGAFAVHEFVYDWSARQTLRYHTGRVADFELAGDLWDASCPAATEVDVLVEFDELLRAAEEPAR